MVLLRGTLVFGTSWHILEEEMDKLDFVFTEFSRDNAKTNVKDVGEWVQSKNGTPDWREKLLISWAGGTRGFSAVERERTQPAGRRRLERPAWQVERRGQVSRLEMRGKMLEDSGGLSQQVGQILLIFFEKTVKVLWYFCNREKEKNGRKQSLVI